ncbi:TPA: 4Fe-4S dicluster domain-containing protein [Escherichia coli]
MIYAQSERWRPAVISGQFWTFWAHLNHPELRVNQSRKKREVTDATKCIGCRTCEVACAVSHQENQDCAALSPDEFISRIRVIKDHSWTTAVACHQCEDAPCANVCPVDAISREHGHIFVEQTRCIGCKSCMLACPFGAMEVVSSRKKARAVKCDLCWHRETGPACVEACPTKALQCMDVEKVQRHRLRQQPV